MSFSIIEGCVMMGDKSPLGFDMGIASVGWAVLDSARVIPLGVGAFDKAEVAKTGASLNLQRRHSTCEASIKIPTSRARKTRETIGDLRRHHKRAALRHTATRKLSIALGSTS